MPISDQAESLRLRHSRNRTAAPASRFKACPSVVDCGAELDQQLPVDWLAGRGRCAVRPRGARAAVTDTALAEVYHRQGMTIAQAATHFGVSEEYVRRRVAEAGLTRRPGPFAPRSAWSPDVLQAQAGKLYGKGMTIGGR